MEADQDQNDARNWHGQRIVGERELDFHSDAQVVRHRRRRQNLVFGLLAFLVVLVLVLALLVFSGRLQLPGQQSAPNAVMGEPISHPHCPQRDFEYLDPSEVRVRVLNTTDISGLGGKTAQLLETRGFEITSVTSAASDYAQQVGAVVSGPQGYAQALSLQRHLPGTLYVFDESKRDDLVDFEVGQDFDELTKLRRLDTAPGMLMCANPPEQSAPATEAAAQGQTAEK